MRKISLFFGALFFVSGIYGLITGDVSTGIFGIVLGALMIYWGKGKKKTNVSVYQKPQPVEAIPDFVAFDFETTGLDAESCDIIQAGAVRYINGKEVESFNMLANPEQHISKKITDITGLTDDDVKNAKPSAIVAAELIEFIDGMPLVAHNAPFDLKFLKKYAPGYQPRVYDTLKMSRDEMPNGSHRLGDLMKIYGIKGNWHDALSDCRAAAELFLILYKPDTEPYRKGRKANNSKW